MLKRRSINILICLCFQLFPYTAIAQKESAHLTADSLLTYANQSINQDLKKTLVATRKALALAQEHGMDEIACKALLQAGNIYTYTGLYTSALEEFHRGLLLARKNKWPELEAEMLTSIGSVYYYQDSLKRALHYYTKSRQILKGQSKSGWAYIRNITNIGQSHRLLGNLKEADHFIRLALRISKNAANAKGMSVNYQNLAGLYADYQKPDSARYFFSQALSVADQHDFLREKMYIYHNMATFFYQSDQKQEAKKYLLKALELSKQTNSNVLMRSIYQELSKQEEQLGNFKNALAYHLLYSRLSDSLTSITQQTEQQHFEYLLQAEQNLSENRILKANVEARELELKASLANHQKQMAITIGAGIALLLVVCIMFFLLYHYQQNKRNHQQLQQMHQAIQGQAKELEDAYSKIQQHNLELENNIGERTRQLNQQNKQLIQYAYFNAHKVRGPLARIMGLVNLLPKADHQTEFTFILDRLNESALELDKVVHEINQILESKPVNQDN